MKKLEITPILNSQDLEGMWPVVSFNEAYQKKPTLLIGCSLVTLGDLTNGPDKSALVVFRVFIEDGYSVKTDQKYVLGIRFYSFGDMATIDLISLGHGYHREMAYDHIKNFNWPIMDNDFQKPVNKFDETTRAPFIFVGGHLKAESENRVNFFSDSGDYGGKVFFSNVNDVASFILSAIPGLESMGGNKQTGEAFVQGIMESMLEHKLQPDFYEQLVEAVNSKPIYGSGFTAQHIGALIMMKVEDRVLQEGKDFLSITIDEMTEGLSRYMLISGVAKNIRQKEIH